MLLSGCFLCCLSRQALQSNIRYLSQWSFAGRRAVAASRARQPCWLSWLPWRLLNANLSFLINERVFIMRQLQIFFVIELDVLEVGVTELEVAIKVSRWCDDRVGREVLIDPVNLCHNLFLRLAKFSWCLF